MSLNQGFRVAFEHGVTLHATAYWTLRETWKNFRILFLFLFLSPFPYQRWLLRTVLESNPKSKEATIRLMAGSLEIYFIFRSRSRMCPPHSNKHLHWRRKERGSFPREQRSSNTTIHYNAILQTALTIWWPFWNITQQEFEWCLTKFVSDPRWFQRSAFITTCPLFFREGVMKPFARNKLLNMFWVCFVQTYRPNDRRAIWRDSKLPMKKPSGVTIICFKTLIVEIMVIFVHNTIDVENQTIVFPQLWTTHPVIDFDPKKGFNPFFGFDFDSNSSWCFGKTCLMRLIEFGWLYFCCPRRIHTQSILPVEITVEMISHLAFY